MRELTHRQQAVVEFIQRHVRRHGRAPSYRDIAAHLRVDVKTAFQHVHALECKGVLERTDGSIELLGEYRPPNGLPVLGRIAAGRPLLTTENLEEYLDVAEELQGDGLFLLRVKGDSMTGAGIHDGDLVLVRSQSMVADGDIAAIAIGEEATVKRVRLGRKQMRLEPANEKYEPMVLKADNGVRIAGKVLMAIRKL